MANYCRAVKKSPRGTGVSVPISTFMCLWANYIFPRWVCLFCWRKYVDRSWEYINCSQTHECVNWGWGRPIPRKGIYKRNCRCSVGYNCTNNLMNFTAIFMQDSGKNISEVVTKLNYWHKSSLLCNFLSQCMTIWPVGTGYRLKIMFGKKITGNRKSI